MNDPIGLNNVLRDRIAELEAELDIAKRHIERLSDINLESIAEIKRLETNEQRWKEVQSIASDAKSYERERQSRDELHRLYSILFNHGLETSNRHAAPQYCEDALRLARQAQEFFEKGTANG